MAAADVLAPPSSSSLYVSMCDDEIICSSEDVIISDISEMSVPHQHDLIRAFNVALLSRVIAEASEESTVKPTVYPKGPHHLLQSMTLLIHRGMDWVMDDGQLSGLQPPPPPPHAHGASIRLKCYRKTELLGKYLIERGFPLIGKGRYTLAFLLTENRVAKVARYGPVFDAEGRSLEPRYQYHRRERNLDVVHYQNHPAAFACTTYSLVRPVLPAGKSSWFDYCAWRHEIYIQELVTPLARAPDFLAPSFMETYPNWRRVMEMLNANPNTPFRQWGRTDSGMLVGFDYH